jgi:hypothetical protein
VIKSTLREIRFICEIRVQALIQKPSTKETNMPHNNREPQPNAPAVDPRWKDLYRWGGIAAAVSNAIIVLAVVAYIIWPYTPNAVSTVSVYAQVLANRIGALMGLDLLYLVGNLFAIPLCLGLYAALRKANESYALLALVMGVMAVTILLTTRPIVEVVSLADRYAAAATDAERIRYLAAGDALLPVFTGAAYYMSYFLGTLSLLIYALLMRGGGVFSRATAGVGVVTNLVAFGMYLPAVGTLFAFLSLAGLIVWNVQLARRFFQLTRMASASPQAA